MAHGAADDSDVRIDSDTYRLDDMAELAVRLGSPTMYNRQGRVIFMDTFANGLNGWFDIGGGDGHYVRLSNEHAYTDGVSCEIYPGGTTPNSIYLYRYIPLVSQGTVAVSVNLSAEANIEELAIVIEQRIADREFYYVLFYDRDAHTISYRNSDLVLVTLFDNVYLAGTYFKASLFKLVIDTDSSEYVSIRYDDQFAPLDDIGGIASAFGQPYGYRIYIVSNVTAGETDCVWVDNVIFTIDET